MASRGWTIKLEFMVENDLNQAETRQLFQDLIGQRRYSRSGVTQTNNERTPLRDVLKQYGLLPLTEAPGLAHLGYSGYNAARWREIQEARDNTRTAAYSKEAVDAS